MYGQISTLQYPMTSRTGRSTYSRLFLKAATANISPFVIIPIPVMYWKPMCFLQSFRRPCQLLQRPLLLAAQKRHSSIPCSGIYNRIYRLKSQDSYLWRYGLYEHHSISPPNVRDNEFIEMIFNIVANYGDVNSS